MLQRPAFCHAPAPQRHASGPALPSTPVASEPEVWAAPLAFKVEHVVNATTPTSRATKIFAQKNPTDSADLARRLVFTTGAPQVGQDAALSLICPLHSLHAISAIEVILGGVQRVIH